MQSPDDLLKKFQILKAQVSSARVKKIFRKPVFIVSTPRSGSTLLFEMLSRCNDFWSIGGESHGVYGAFPQLKAENALFDSGRLTARHADKDTADTLRVGFLAFLQNSHGTRFLDLPKKPEYIRFLEKTPRNALNIPFLKKVFPDARFILLHRDPRQNISSIINVWELPNFITYPNLPGWRGPPWHLLLPPGWRELNGKPVADIAAFQWRKSNMIMMEDLKSLSSTKWISVRYEDLVDDPAKEMQRICKFSGVEFDRQLQYVASAPLTLSRSTVTSPDPDKWKKHEAEIMRILPGVEDVAGLLQRLGQ